jgi:Protein of unknown function (DUF3987)
MSVASQPVHPPVKPDLKPEALYGLIGDIVRTIEPYSEADPVAVLVTQLAYFGNIVGRGPFYKIEATPHYPNLFTVLVGKSSKSRKGTSKSTTDYMYNQIDSKWVDNCFASGLSSGEGLIWRLRDKSTTNPGAKDKRLMVSEEEFSSPLKRMTRDTNTLSELIRNAWDGKPLVNLIRNAGVGSEKATNTHISIVGHITETELLKQLTQTDRENGFANRFLWFYIDRSKFLPSPKGVPQAELDPLIIQLKKTVSTAQTIKEMTRNSEAETLWEKIYAGLTTVGSDLTGALTSRAEAQVLRVSMIYALADSSPIIRAEHLNAALAVWDYCKQSVEIIFPDQTGDRNVDRAIKLLKTYGFVTKKALYAYFGRNIDKQEVDRIVNVLCNSGLANLQTKNGAQAYVEI